jgi:hypothetical protein
MQIYNIYPIILYNIYIYIDIVNIDIYNVLVLTHLIALVLSPEVKKNRNVAYHQMKYQCINERTSFP